jgi:hypothetical protein
MAFKFSQLSHCEKKLQNKKNQFKQKTIIKFKNSHHENFQRKREMEK